MIENLRYITNEGDMAYLEISKEKYGSSENISFYYKADQSRKEVFRVMGNPYNGVAWEYQGKTISFLDNTFEGVWVFPSLDYKYIIAIYRRSEKYPKPKNLVVYNADGSVHLDGVDLSAHPHFSKFDSYLQFNWVYYKEDKEWKNWLVIDVGDWGTIEHWEFNPETGEFVKQLKGNTRA